MRYVLSVLVENHSGVLAKVSLLFSRRGYNIESLTVCETQITGQSRMTIVVSGDEHTLDQIIKQLSKLVEVISIKNCDKSKNTQRMMALVKVKAEGAQRTVIIGTCEIYHAHIVDVCEDSVIIEVTGSKDKIDSLLKLLTPYGILEFVKTGLVAMERGNIVMA